MKRKYLVLIILSFIMLMILSGCGENTNTTQNTNKTTNSTAKNNTATEQNTKQIDYEEAAKEQMKEPEEGEEIAILHIKDYGDVKIKFFKDVAPKAVENFVTHAKEGYYDGLTFHRVINEFMIQGGDPLGNGTGGESIWGEDFGEELDSKLVPYRGTLCMASRGTGTKSIGSQFFITQANYNENMKATLEKANYPTDLLKMYQQYGGYMSLYMSYTIFGQVIDGMDVIDKVASVETNANDKPVQDVIIEKIEITTYQK